MTVWFEYSLVNTKHGMMFPFSMLIFFFSPLILASYDCFCNKIGDKGNRWQMKDKSNKMIGHIFVNIKWQTMENIVN
jgi:hypothetical protein